MMKIRRKLWVLTLLAILLPVSLQAKTVVKPKGYLFGFVANFTDSVVYFTDIQEVDSVWFDDKSKFLLGRQAYANQLRDYFNDKLNLPHRTCIVSFGMTRDKAEKKYVKMKRLYTVKNAGKYDVRTINENEFRFQPVDMSYAEEQESAPVSSKKKSKSKKKEAPKKASK